jgi:hypothetical protein
MSNADLKTTQFGEAAHASDERITGTGWFGSAEIVEDLVTVVWAQCDLPVGLAKAAPPRQFFDQGTHDSVHFGAVIQVCAFVKHTIGIMHHGAQMSGVDARCETPGDVR